MGIGRGRFCRNGLLFFLMVFALLSARSRAEGSDRPYYTDIGQFNYAKFLMREGDYKAASKEFARFIEGFPESPLMPEAQFGLCKAYFNAGLFREAEEELSLYLSNFGESPDALEALVLLSETEKKLKEKSIPVITPRPGEPIKALRAVQVMLFEGKDYRELEDELDSLKNGGVDTVILRVFHNSGDRYYPFAKSGDRRGVYFNTTHSPVVDDILSQVLPAAHRRGLKVFAWMTTRYADYGAEGDAALSCKGYDISKKTPAPCKGLDLFNEDAVRRLEGIYSDLAKYDIDGVLFQDDLVLRHNEGFGPFMESEFKKDTGENANPEGFYLRQENGEAVHYTQPFWKWASWKNRRLLKVAQRLKDAVREKRPQAKFAINLMYESVTNPPYALAWLSQNLDEAVKAGFDYYSIMAYHRQMEEELNKTPEEVRDMIARMAGDAVRAIGEPGRVLIKLQTIDWKTGDALENSEVVSVIRLVKGKALSLAVVPYRVDFPFYEMGEARAEGLASIGLKGAI